MASEEELRVRVSARTEQFERSMRSTSESFKRFDNESKKMQKALDSSIPSASGRSEKAMSAFNRSMRSAADNAALITGPLGGVSSRINIIARNAGNGKLALFGMGAALGALSVATVSAIREGEKFETLQLKTEGLLRATANAAGITAKEIRTMSQEIAAATLANTDQVEEAAQTLLRFTSIQEDNFRRTLMMAQNLADAGFGSITSAVEILGRAADQPAEALGRLERRLGDFTRGQRESIKEMQESGRTMEAWEIIMNSLEGRVGGLSEAMAGGTAGKRDSLGQAVEELTLAFNEATGSQSKFNTVVDATTSAVNRVTNAIKSYSGSIKQQIDLTTESFDVLITRGPKAYFEIITTGAARERTLMDERIRMAKEATEAKEEEAKAAAKVAAEAERLRAAQSRDEKRFADVLAEVNDELEKRAQKARQDAEAMEQRRVATVRSLRDEVEVLGEVNRLYIESGESYEEAADKAEYLRTIRSLGIADGTKEAENIRTLIQLRNEQSRAFENERKAREELNREEEKRQQQQEKINEDQRRSLEITRNRIREMEVEIQTIGMARGEAEAYRVQQELLNAAMERFGVLTSDQIAEIEEIAQKYGEVAAKIEEINEQKRAEERQTRILEESNRRMLETFTGGLTDAILHARSFEDAMKDVALQISKAIIQAKLLESIGSGGSAGGGGGGFLGGLGNIFASVLHTGTNASRRSTPVSAFIGAPRLHNGLAPDEFPAILQRGEKVIPKNEVQNGKGVSVNMVVNTPDANSFKASDRQIARSLRNRVGATS